jgi:hypothetical protein
LHDLRGILAIAAYSVKTKQGTIDRKFLEWLKATLENKGTPDRFGVLQQYPVPLLDSRVSALWSFDTLFQRKLLEIKQRLHRLDDLVERARKYFDMTFTKLEPETRVQVETNLQEILALYADSAERLAELMRKLED